MKTNHPLLKVVMLIILLGMSFSIFVACSKDSTDPPITDDEAVVDDDDVLVLELGRSPRFEDETSIQFGIAADEELDGYPSPQLDITSQENRPHTSATDFPDDLIVANTGSRFRQRCLDTATGEY